LFPTFDRLGFPLVPRETRSVCKLPIHLAFQHSTILKQIQTRRVTDPFRDGISEYPKALFSLNVVICRTHVIAFTGPVLCQGWYRRISATSDLTFGPSWYLLPQHGCGAAEPANQHHAVQNADTKVLCAAQPGRAPTEASQDCTVHRWGWDAWHGTRYANV
jgi:hypothetical protein